jgi:hypothetical protein
VEQSGFKIFLPLALDKINIASMHLVKGKDGNWTLIGDTPFPEPKKGN